MAFVKDVPEGADFTAMDGPTILRECGDNAMNWARAFCQYAKRQGHIIDEGWTVGWFANAIEHSQDVRHGTGPTVLPDGSAFFTT